MSAKLTFTLYSANSGIEVTPDIKAHRGVCEGRLQLRFFLIQEPGATAGGKLSQIRFLLEPWEAYDLSLRMSRIYRDGGKEKVTHKFTPTGGKEVTTFVTVDKWERAGKSGLGLAVSRADSFISVPISKDSVSRYLYLAEFLKFLSCRQGWIDKEAA